MGTHRFQLDSIDAALVGNLSEPGLIASTLAARPEIDVTLANDALLPDLVIAMAQFGYTFVASTPTTPRRTSNLIVDLSDPGVSPVAPASTYRQRYDNTQKALLLSVDGGPYSPLAVSPPNGAAFFDDFLTASGTSLGHTLWVAVTSGAGSAVNVSSGAAPALVNGAHQGLVIMQTGSTAAGRASMRQAGLSYSNVAAAGGNSRIEFLATMGDVLATALENYTVMYGWSDNVGAAGYGANAALLVHDFALSATNWVAKSVVGGVPVNTVTAIPIAAAGTWSRLLIDISSGSAARFFVDGVLAATHALATLPTATAGFWAPITKVEKTVGTAQRRIGIDYASWSYRLSPAR